ncbi:helix-turn-helix transcriptional regulator [Weissella viridescens]|uniref:helix-turn-helix domain-containing protein n=1 Tax=Weissella viridescens TaxID=1629 RepID=UPI001D06D4AB|nr:helix-turn-helix domain-containing protein [Weissella viridescens]MCB6840797.1 helix-turn-helix transcriptional regulator [Weissella viridescens]MCB6847486.1 helix-turn-helix transcriptional regulator [Weissella viridescens]
MTTLDRIKQVAKQRGYSLTQVNEKANLGKNTIYSWKTKEPGLNNLKAVADVLGVSVDYLLGNTDEMHPVNKSVSSNEADLKDIMEEFNILKFDGKEIDPNDLPVIERIIKGLLDDRN